MLKTAPCGTTSVAGIKRYLINHQRQEHESHKKEWDSYTRGQIQLSAQQRGYLADYLGQQSRGLAIDVSEDLSVANWAKEMDCTRKHYGHDCSTRTDKPRTYYHFILSPSMDDNCSLSTLREYAKTWANENFRSGDRQHEYAIVYHDDNAKGILHAHIVVNVTNTHTKKKLHLSNDEVVQLELSAQEIGKRYGLTPLRENMNTTIGSRTTQPVYLDRKEREILNKGGYSWKWQLRKTILATASLSKDFDDFKLRLNQAGYDVDKSTKTGYLTYTHKNGHKVKDNRLGARFYLESLQQMFLQEQILDDKTYSSWELIKLSKGEVPWKEDIRRAIDELAPTVLSILELKQALLEQYGIRLIINRRGITYQHACGFKVRDIGIGFRYTTEGLYENAVMNMQATQPAYNDVLKASYLITKQYLYRLPKAKEDAFVWGATQFVYREMIELFSRYDAKDVKDLGTILDAQYESLRTKKSSLTSLKQQVMHWNHLAILVKRSEKDHELLTSEDASSIDAETYNETLLRYQRIQLYLKEQSGDNDILQTQAKLQNAYEEELKDCQTKLDILERDSAIYRTFLMSSDDAVLEEPAKENSFTSPVQRLFRAGRVLEANNIKDYFQLGQTISSYETKRDLAQFRLEKALDKKQSIRAIYEDVLVCMDAKTFLPKAAVLADQAEALGLGLKANQYEESLQRLKAQGIKETDYNKHLVAYDEVVNECLQLRKSLNEITSKCTELKDAQQTCLEMTNLVKSVPWDYQAKELPVFEEEKQQETILSIDEARKRTKSHETKIEISKEKEPDRMR